MAKSVGIFVVLFGGRWQVMVLHKSYPAAIEVA